MAITDTGHDSTKITRFYGLSTDTKPVATAAMIGATFYETDTKHGFIYDGVVWNRSEQFVVEQAAAITLNDILTTNSLLANILIEMRINNMHQAVITGDVLTEEDIEDGSD